MTSAPGTTDQEAPNLTVMVAAIGATVRQLRKEAGLTLEQLADRGQLSVGLVSQLERGKGNPSFATLVQIAHGLSVPVGRLMLIENTPSPVVRASQRRRVDTHGIPGDLCVYEMLTPDLNGALQVTWVHALPGHDTSATPFVHHGEEVGIVLTGSLDVHVGDASYRLDAGDSIRFSSTVPHWFVNRGTETVDALWVSTPPSW